MSVIVPATPPPARHALGLPPGSVRAVQTLIIVGLVCALVLMPPRGGSANPIRPYLLYLLFLAVGHFYAAHGKSISPVGGVHPAPLHLPPGFVRVLIVLLLAGTLAYKLATDREGLAAQMTASVALLQDEPYLPVIILAGFFLGVIFRWVIGGERSYWGQDVQAWLSLVAALGLGVAALIHLVIEPSMEERLHLPNWEGFLAGMVAFYFGERS